MNAKRDWIPAIAMKDPTRRSTVVLATANDSVQRAMVMAKVLALCRLKNMSMGKKHPGWIRQQQQ